MNQYFHSILQRKMTVFSTGKGAKTAEHEIYYTSLLSNGFRYRYFFQMIVFQ